MNKTRERNNIPGSFQFLEEPNALTATTEAVQRDEQVSAAEYQQHIVHYVTEWESAVTAKVDSEIKEVKKLQQFRLHYEKKVDGLRRKVVALDSRGKELPTDLVEKVDRNEQKLREAWEEHEKRASLLCTLIEEVTRNGWKDVYPLVGNLLKWEYNKSSRDSTNYGKFPTILNSLQSSFGGDGLKSSN